MTEQASNSLAPALSGEDAANLDSRESRRSRLREAVEHAAHVLPVQGPIGVFVHHNTLHAFQHRPFERAVLDAARIFGAEPYLAEAAYRAEIARGRIRIEDIDTVIESEPDAEVFPGLNRHALRRAMIAPGVREFDAATILWRAEQGDLARDFRQPALKALFEACRGRTVAHDDEPAAVRPVDEVIHPWLIRVCSMFLDQGMAYWRMPLRERGFYESVRILLSRGGGIFPRYLVGLDKEFRRQEGCSFSSTDAVLDYLDCQTLRDDDWGGILQAELLALPGWAGLMRRLEEIPELAPHKTLPCSLMDFLAVRLTMVRIAAQQGAGEMVPIEPPLKTAEKRHLSRAARVYDAARVVSLSANEVAELPQGDWAAFAREVKACNGWERRRILHLAYEGWHERHILSGLAGNRKYRGLNEPKGRPAAQLFLCIDEREESIRRAIEETDAEVETFGAAGFFGVAVDYQGIDDPHGAAFCPITVKPLHSVLEKPHEEDRELSDRRRRRRRFLGRIMQNTSVSSRTLMRGWLSTTTLGLLSAFPLIGQLLAPRRYAQWREWLNRAFLPEPQTELVFMRDTAEAQQAIQGLLSGFAASEEADRVASVLVPAGLTHHFARLVVVLGHGSTSLNNPHESAHDCGACGGRRGGPNARLFAAMANRPEVRALLRDRGVEIPDDVWFIGGYHDSCSDDVELFDLRALPATHRADLERVLALLDKARAQDAHERARRFENAPAQASPEAALRHVEERSEHLAQPRPEYGHCTNAVCVVGRRGLTRGVFLDRRAFLASYEPNRDPDDKNLAQLLAAVIPVCAGINLEYYFSVVDNDRYGCGTKLPHNVTGLVGVMDGHASDLRTGLPWQMVEIHEPVRMLFVIETTPQRLSKVISTNAGLAQLLHNRWIRLATIDPASGLVHVYRSGVFEKFDGPLKRLPVAFSSAEWYEGKIEHLPMASIQRARS